MGKEPNIGGETARDRRVGEVLNDFMDRRARGENAIPEELLSEHPDLADDLREHLRLLDDIRPGADRIQDLIARGVLTACGEEEYAASLGPYKIIEYIGRGGMGIVLKALDPSLNRPVAIKILRPDLADDDAVLSRFEREARAAAALRHPNIVTVHAVGQDRGVRFIVMEYVDGPSLAEVLAGIRDRGSGIRRSGRPPCRPSAGSGIGDRGSNAAADPRVGRDAAAGLRAGRPPPAISPQPSACSLQPEFVRHVFTQLLEALGAAHAAGLIHRDVKPSNILLDRWSGEAVSPQPSAGTESRRRTRGNVERWERAKRTRPPPLIPDPRSPIPRGRHGRAALNPQSPIPNP